MSLFEPDRLQELSEACVLLRRDTADLLLRVKRQADAIRKIEDALDEALRILTEERQQWLFKDV
jgi:hypothetical protein